LFRHVPDLIPFGTKEPRRFKILNVAQHSPEELCEQVLETLKKSSTFKKQHQPSSKKVSRS
jgi:hypothetical protein